MVNRGVSSSLYGALGSVGSINIVTKKPAELHASTKAEYGEYQTYMLAADVSAPLGNFYTWLSGSYQHSNGYNVSKKLTATERRAWFDKLVQWNLYRSDPGTLAASSSYLDGKSRWEHSSYSKYQLNGRVGYAFTDTLEAGVSAYFYSNKQEANSYSSTTNASYTNVWKSVNPVTAFTTDGKSAALQNRVFSWPEDTRLTVSPYFSGEFGNLSLRANVFYTKQRNNLEAWANQAESTLLFPSSVYYIQSNTVKSYWELVQSIYEETSYGFFFDADVQNCELE